MALKDVLKINRKTFFNPRAWLSYDTVKEQTGYVVDLAKTVFKTPPPAATPTGVSESFDEATKRFRLSEEDLKKIQSNYLLAAVFFLGIGILVILFSFYLVFTGSFAGFLIGLGISFFLLSQAFQYHFWYFQIKHKQLGLTFEEWRAGKPKNEGSA